MPPQEEPPSGDGPHPEGEQRSEELLSPGQEVLAFLLTMGVVSIPFVCISGRTLPFALCGFLMLSYFIFRRPRVWLHVARLALSLAVWVSMFSPVDATIRRSDEFNLRFVRVATCLGSWEPVRRFEALGLKKNIDFVVYEQQPLANTVKYAIVFFVPGQEEEG